MRVFAWILFTICYLSLVPIDCDLLSKEEKTKLGKINYNVLPRKNISSESTLPNEYKQPLPATPLSSPSTTTTRALLTNSLKSINSFGADIEAKQFPLEFSTKVEIPNGLQKSVKDDNLIGERRGGHVKLNASRVQLADDRLSDSLPIGVPGRSAGEGQTMRRITKRSPKVKSPKVKLFPRPRGTAVSTSTTTTTTTTTTETASIVPDEVGDGTSRVEVAAKAQPEAEKEEDVVYEDEDDGKELSLKRKTDPKLDKTASGEATTQKSTKQTTATTTEKLRPTTTVRPTSSKSSSERVRGRGKSEPRKTTVGVNKAPDEDESDSRATSSKNNEEDVEGEGETEDSEDSEDGEGEGEGEEEAAAVKTTTTTLAPISSKRTKNKKQPLVPLPFIKPKNASICTSEAYLEFPADVIGNKWRARGLVLVHIAVAGYMFYSLALVCERYFMPSLEEFSQRLQLSEDVAGATLMSAGSSAPELFTAMLGVFVAKGDVGTGAIVGSAVFNILFVIGICAFVSTNSAQLDWWPVLRDSVFYTFTVLVLILFIYDERVTAIESFLMLALYGIYILIMIHNEAIKEQVTRALQSHPLSAKLISGSSSSGVDGPDDVFGSTSSAQTSASKGFLGSSNQRNYQTTSLATKKSTQVEDDSMYLAAQLIILKHKRLFRAKLRFQSAARYIIVKRQHRVQQKSIKCSDEVNYFGPESEPLNQGANQKERMEAYAMSATMSKNKFSIVSKDDYEFWNRPPEEGENYYIWLAKIPVNYVLHYTIPDCSLYPDRYLFTFFISIAWTALFSYIMVWMVTLIGYTFGIPDSVMGVTFLAAGTSVPDCYSSIHAAKNGMANMAVSNSIGSNVFDILVGLSVPWFIQTAIYPQVVATINSRGVIYSVILLFVSLIVTIYLMNKYDWTLKPRLGLALLIAYGLFIVLTCMLEFNLFGHVNPPPCPVK